MGKDPCESQEGCIVCASMQGCTKVGSSNESVSACAVWAAVLRVGVEGDDVHHWLPQLCHSAATAQYAASDVT